ncbi:MAG: hypothetical protein NVSMB66_7550 [Candidatus Doudnabacteria bacterium]
METLHQLPVINISELTKESSENLAELMISNILEGDMNPLEFSVKKKLITDALDMVLKNEGVKSMAITEVQKFGKEGATSLGANITLKELPKYDYSKDATWCEIKKQMEPLESWLKEHEDNIKMATKKGVQLMDSEGTVLAAPVPVTSTTSIAVSFPKAKK